MNFVAGNIYHIYNRGNNKQTIFFTDRNYVYFLRKMKKYIQPHCHILAYVLMPKHFHFLIQADERTEKELTHLPIAKNVLSEGIRLLLSSYTKGINKQENMTGNLIQQKTKSKCVFDASGPSHNGYAETCFHYIHQNPVKAGLAEKTNDWPYSSVKDYFRDGDNLCNKELVFDLLGNGIDIAQKMNTIIDEKEIINIF